MVASGAGAVVAADAGAVVASGAGAVVAADVGAAVAAVVAGSSELGSSPPHAETTSPNTSSTVNSFSVRRISEPRSAASTPNAHIERTPLTLSQSVLSRFQRPIGC